MWVTIYIYYTHTTLCTHACIQLGVHKIMYTTMQKKLMYTTIYKQKHVYNNALKTMHKIIPTQCCIQPCTQNPVMDPAHTTMYTCINLQDTQLWSSSILSTTYTFSSKLYQLFSDYQATKCKALPGCLADLGKARGYSANAIVIH